MRRSRRFPCPVLTVFAGFLFPLIHLHGQWDNDNFNRRALLAGTNVVSHVYLVDATTEAEEPDLWPWNGGSVWFAWTPPAAGHLRLHQEVLSPGSIPGLSVFSGTELSSLQAVNAAYAGFEEFRLWPIEGQTPYAIVSSKSPSPLDQTAPLSTIHLEFIPVPPNDRFENRFPLTRERPEARGWNTGGTQEALEPWIDPNQTHPTVWYGWVAPDAGVVSFEVHDNPIGAWAEAFVGTALENLQPVPRNGGEVPESLVPGGFRAEARIRYHFGVSAFPAYPFHLKVRLHRLLTTPGLTHYQSFSQPAEVRFGLNGFLAGDVVTSLTIHEASLGVVFETNRQTEVNLGPLMAGEYRLHGFASCASGNLYLMGPTYFVVNHPNDRFTDRQILTGSGMEFEADGRGATTDPGDETPGSIWWGWTAPRAGRVIFQHLAGGEVTFALLEGGSLQTLEPVAENLVQAGRTYVIRGSAHTASLSRYRLDLFTLPVPNDDFASSTSLNQESFSEVIDLSLATFEPGEPLANPDMGYPSVWYSFTAPTDGNIQFGASQGEEPYLVPQVYVPSLFVGDSLDDLQPVTPFGGQDIFFVSAGDTYHLRVQHPYPAQRSLVWFHFRFAPAPSHSTFAERVFLTGAHVEFPGTTDGAFAEPDEPDGIAGYPPRRSVWWSWTAPGDGWAAVDEPAARSFENLPDLEVFTGEDLTSLEPVALTPLEWWVRFFQAEAGQTYHFRLSDSVTDLLPALPLRALRVDLSDLQIVSPEDLDDFRLPATPGFELSGSPLGREGTTLSFREQIGYGGIGFHEGIVLYTNHVSELPWDTVWHPVGFPPGTNILYAVATEPDGATSYSPPVRVVLRPENDDFISRLTLSGRRVSVEGTVTAATVEADEPALGLPPADFTVWHTWTAPAAGTVIARVISESYVRVYTGFEIESLTELNDSAPVGNSHSFLAQTGETYQILVGTPASQSSFPFATVFTLSLEQSTIEWQAPSVETFTAGEPIPISLFTAEPPEAIQSVSVKVGAGTLFSIADPPYFFLWTNAPQGSHTLRAVVRFASGEEHDHLTRNVRVRPPNDDFHDAILLGGGTATAQPDLTGADREGVAGPGTVWYRWQAEQDGMLLIRSLGSATAPTIEVSTGNDPLMLTNIALQGSLRNQGWTAAPITSGMLYNIRVTDSPRPSPELVFEEVAPPPNDWFAGSLPVPGSETVIRGFTFLATPEEGEPAPNGEPLQRSLWWHFTPPETGSLILSVPQGGIFIYEGDTLSSLVPVLPTTVHPDWFPVSGGVTYRLVLDGQLPEVDWQFAFRPPPENDAFSQRTPLSGRRLTFTADLALATVEPNEPEPDGFVPSRTVWWSWMAPTGGLVSLGAAPGQEPTEDRFAVYQGDSLETLTLLSTDRRTVQFPAEAGQTYQIAADDGGHILAVRTFELILQTPPPNDSFVNRTALSGSATSATGWTIGARRDEMEPRHASTHGGRSAWYSWEAPATSKVQIRVEGDIAETLLAVYQGETLPGLLEVASTSGTNGAALVFDARAGTTYQIAVDGRHGSDGDFDLFLETIGAAGLPWLTIERTPGQGTLQLQAHNLLGRAVRLEESPDLLTWTTVVGEPPGAEEVFFTVFPESTAVFFRMVVEH